MGAYQIGQWIGALLYGVLFVWAWHRLVFRKVIPDEVMSVVAAGLAAFATATALGYFGYANGRERSLAYVPFIKYMVGTFAGCAFRIWRDNGIEERRAQRGD